MANSYVSFFSIIRVPGLLGDFNKKFYATEKFGGRSINNSRSNQFANCINYCNLIYLDFKSSKYTWTNKRRYGFHILERLDRLFANYDWLSLFLESVVRHLPRTQSDHTPLLLTLQPPWIDNSHIFHFETSHPDFIHILDDSWHPSPSFINSIDQFQHNIIY